MRTVTIDHELLEQAHTLRERATSLRTQAETLVPVLGATYRRRASELELEAFLTDVAAGVEVG
jgi:CHAD domain-containing protein